LERLLKRCFACTRANSITTAFDEEGKTIQHTTLPRWLLLVAVILALLPNGASPSSRRLAVRTASLSAWARPALGYPRIANYNGLQEARQAPFMAGDDLVVARQGAPIAALRSANPRAIALLYQRSLQVDLDKMFSLYATHAASVPATWWLLGAGSRLATRVDGVQTTLVVADPRRFRRCDDIQIDHESMHVLGVQDHLLHVERGDNSTSSPHGAGALVEIHFSYRTDLSNCAAISRRPWSFNLSSLCPRANGQTWADFMAQHVAYAVRNEGWSGVFMDNLPDLPQSPLVDVNNDGVPDGGVVGGVNVWRQGERALLAELRRLLPGFPIVVNGDLQLDKRADGRELEGFPLIPGAALSAALDGYLYDSDNGRVLTIVNPDTITRPSPSLRSARLAASVALLGDGEVAYDRGWVNHGTPWWFDIYDGGAGSATSTAVRPEATYLPVIHPGRFKRGDLLLVDEETMAVRVVNRHGLTVVRGVAGTSAAFHGVGTAVTTAAQRSAGRGYLGRPLGPARLIETRPWHGSMLPLSVQGVAAIDGQPARAVSTALSPRSSLTLFSTGYYNPFAVRLSLRAAPAAALRTLVFDARGPAGDSLWLRAGALSVPLILRAGWHRYVIPVAGEAVLTLGAGRIRGTTALRAARLLPRQAFVWRRDFTRGSVVVNPTDVSQAVPLGRPWRLLGGDQSSSSGGAQVVRMLHLPRYGEAVVLPPA